MWDIGVDIVEVERFRRMNYSSHERFYNRIFTPSEIKYCLSSKESAQRFAATYAGKEAVYKAINKYVKIGLREIEILRDKDGRPKVNLKIDEEKMSKLTHNLNIPIDVKISLSHISSYAIAFAMIKIQETDSSGAKLK